MDPLNWKSHMTLLYVDFHDWLDTIVGPMFDPTFLIIPVFVLDTILVINTPISNIPFQALAYKSNDRSLPQIYCAHVSCYVFVFIS